MKKLLILTMICITSFVYGYTSIIFDVGDVLLKGPDAQLTVPYQQLALPKSDAWKMWLEGKINLVQLRSQLQSICDLLQVDELLQLYLDPARPFIDECFEAARQLKKLGYRLYILSNFSHDSYHTFIEPHPELFGIFDGMLFSCDAGCSKPDETIFRSLLARYNLEASECLFIDDVQANIVAAQKIGIDGIVYKSGTLKRCLAEHSIFI